MNKIRVIARIDIKNDYVIKGIHLEGLRKVGEPNTMSMEYYCDDIDEIIFMDAVAAYYDRNSLGDIVRKTCRGVFIPITVGGGIRTIDDIRLALKNGADKVAINTQAVKTPEFIKNASEVFGSQCIVSSIDAKQVDGDRWEVYVDNGRESTGLDVVEWAESVESLGAGEIMLTSIDREGTKKGFDICLNQAVSSKVSIPVISSGGMGSVNHSIELLKGSNVDAIAIASVLHYKLESVSSIKDALLSNDIKVRFENSNY